MLRVDRGSKAKGYARVIKTSEWKSFGQTIKKYPAWWILMVLRLAFLFGTVVWSSMVETLTNIVAGAILSTIGLSQLLVCVSR